MTEAEIRDAIARHDLDAYADAIVAKAAPAYAISAEQIAGGQEPESGASRFGGEPHMPPGAAWPSKDGAPLGFLGQIRLSDVTAGPERDSLPAQGRLLFFYDVREGGAAWGFDPADVGSWAVLYAPDESAMERTPLPEALLEIMEEDWGEREPFTAAAMKFEPTLTIPGYEALGLELPEDDAEKYFELLDEFGGESEEEEDRDARPLHQLLGHASEVQGEMASE